MDERSGYEFFEDNRSTFTLWLVISMIGFVPIAIFDGLGFISVLAIVGLIVWLIRKFEDLIRKEFQ